MVIAIERAEYLNDYSIKLTFSDGVLRVVFPDLGFVQGTDLIY